MLYIQVQGNSIYIYSHNVQHPEDLNKPPPKDPSNGGQRGASTEKSQYDRPRTRFSSSAQCSNLSGNSIRNL